MEWDGDKDIEAVSRMFIEFLWSTSETTHAMLKAEIKKQAIVDQNRKEDEAFKKKKKRVRAPKEDKEKEVAAGGDAAVADKNKEMDGTMRTTN